MPAHEAVKSFVRRQFFNRRPLEGNRKNDLIFSLRGRHEGAGRAGEEEPCAWIF